MSNDLDKNKKVPNVPNLRFPGFSYNWTLCKLSDISERLEYGIGASAINFNGKHRYIRITDISNWGKNEIT